MGIQQQAASGLGSACDVHTWAVQDALWSISEKVKAQQGGTIVVMLPKSRAG